MSVWAQETAASWKLLAALVVTLTLATSCSSSNSPPFSPPPPPRPEQGEQLTLVTVDTDVPNDYSIERIDVTMGHRKAEFGPLGTKARDTRWVTIKPRAHMFQVVVLTKVKEGLLSAPCTLRWHRMMGVRVGWDQATIHVKLRSLDPSLPLDKRLAMDISLEGASREPLPVAEGGFDERHCRKLDPISQADCRVAAAISDANSTRSVVRKLCYLDIQKSIDTLKGQYQKTRESEGDAAAEPVLKKLEAESARLDTCLSQNPVYIEETNETRVESDCDGTSPR